MSLTSKVFYQADAHMRGVTLSLMDFKPDSVLMDCGCGDCQFTTELVNKLKPSKVLAVDASGQRRHYADERNWIPVAGDLNYPLPVREETVDIIHAGQVIEHLDNTDTFIKEIKRILKPDGYAVITTPNLASWHNILSLLYASQPMTCMVSDSIPVSKIPEDKDMPKHRRIFTHDGLIKLLKYHGLKVEKVKGAGFYPFGGWMQNTLASLDCYHSAYVIVKARKDAS